MPGNHATSNTGGPSSRPGFMANMTLERFAALMNTVWTIRIVLSCALLAVVVIPHLASSPAANVPNPTSLTSLEAAAVDVARMAAETETELDRFLREPRRVLAHPGIHRQLLADIKAYSSQIKRPEMTAFEAQEPSPCIAEVEQDEIDIKTAAAMVPDGPTAKSPRTTGLSCSSHVAGQLKIDASSSVEPIADWGTSDSPQCGEGRELPTIFASWETSTAAPAPARAQEPEHGRLEDSTLNRGAGRGWIRLSHAAPSSGVHRDLRSDHGICFVR
ncbi:MAG: hypothetical protein OXH60_09925 [Rhodospirillales bacterium]|nr:hypothetical protein [Rhodospirillales bacterium]